MPRQLTEAEIQSFRQSLVHAARQRLVENGYAALTIRGIAADLGCSPMTPYRYFSNKAEIALAVRQHSFDRFGDAMRAALLDVDDPIERLRTLGRSYVRYGVEHPEDYRIMFQLDSGEIDFDANDALASRAKSSWLTLLTAVQSGIDANVIAGDALEVAHLLWAGVHGLVTLHLSNRLGWGLGLDTLVDSAFAHFLRGVRPEKGTLA